MKTTSEFKFKTATGKDEILKVTFQSPDKLADWLKEVSESRLVYHLHSKSVAHHGQSWIKAQYATSLEPMAEAKEGEVLTPAQVKRNGQIEDAKSYIQSVRDGTAVFEVIPLLPEERAPQDWKNQLLAKIQKAGFGTEAAKQIRKDYFAGLPEADQAQAKADWQEFLVNLDD